jgi:hypothetical protein
MEMRSSLLYIYYNGFVAILGNLDVNWIQISEIQRESSTVPIYDYSFVGGPSTTPFLYIVALEGHTATSFT